MLLTFLSFSVLFREGPCALRSGSYTQRAGLTVVVYLAGCAVVKQLSWSCCTQGNDDSGLCSRALWELLGKRMEKVEERTEIM